MDLFDGTKSVDARKEAMDERAQQDFDSIPVLLRPPIKICKLLCGGMHTVALSSAGIPYSWGCNDDKALGRDGPEQDILPVMLSMPVDGIAVGDSHSIFYNTQQSVAFLCGLYSVSEN